MFCVWLGLIFMDLHFVCSLDLCLFYFVGLDLDLICFGLCGFDF